PRTGARRPPLRIAFVSDIHIGPTTPTETIANAFTLLRNARPDVLVLGGDYVYGDVTDEAAAELERWAGSIAAPLKLAVLGNHDLWTDHGRLERALERAGVRMLINDAVRLPAPHTDTA